MFKGDNLCGDNNGMCSHICFPLPTYNMSKSTKTGCMCPDFFIMEAENNTCTEMGMYNVITLVRYHLYKPNLYLTGNMIIVNLPFNEYLNPLKGKFHLPNPYTCLLTIKKIQFNFSLKGNIYLSNPYTCLLTIKTKVSIIIVRLLSLAVFGKYTFRWLSFNWTIYGDPCESSFLTDEIAWFPVLSV